MMYHSSFNGDEYEVHKRYHNSNYPWFCGYCDRERAQRYREAQERRNNKKIPNCEYCDAKPAYGDERNAWLGAHNAWWHKSYYAIKRFFLA